MLSFILGAGCGHIHFSDPMSAPAGAMAKGKRKRTPSSSTRNMKPARYCHRKTASVPQEPKAAGIKPLDQEQSRAVYSIVESLRMQNEALHQRLLRYKLYAPGIDIDLQTEAMTAQDATARARLYKTVNTLVALKTARDMHEYVMRLSAEDAAYFDAWRRQYFLKCLAQQRDYRNVLSDFLETEQREV